MIKTEHSKGIIQSHRNVLYISCKPIIEKQLKMKKELKDEV